MLNDVFELQNIDGLLHEYADTLSKLRAIEKKLKDRFVGMNDAVDALILAVLTGEPLLLIGPPGTAKSRLISEFYQYVRDETKEGDYFRYLLTRFTEPNELFGYYDIRMEKNTQRLQRITKNMMQEARVVFLDEVFNASSAILNSLLTFIAEREFYDRGESYPVSLQCLFGATNDIPYENELRAIFDRFTLRWQVRNVSVDAAIAGQNSLEQLLKAGWIETYGRFDGRDQADAKRLRMNSQYTSNQPSDSSDPEMLDNLRRLQLAVKQRTASNDIVPVANSGFYDQLKFIIQNCRQYDYSEMSNRRIIKLLHVMFMHSLYQAHKNNENPLMAEDQLALMRFAVDRWDNHLNNFMPGTVYAAHDE